MSQGRRNNNDRASDVAPVKRFSRSFARHLGPNKNADAALRSYAVSYIWPENVVTRFRLANYIDLRRITAWWYHSYIPHRFETLTMRVTDQRTATILFFGTGRVVLAGPPSMDHAFEGMHRARTALEAIGKETSVDECEPVNMVYVDSIESNHGVDLAHIYADNMDKAEWSPVTFPGMKLTDSVYNVKYRIFDTPVLLVMGSRNAHKISEIIQHAKDVIAQYPDDALPGPDGRFAYRQEKKRLACSEIEARELKTTTTDTVPNK